MVFYENETAIGLAIASLPALGALYFFFIRENKSIAIWLLLISAFCLRLLMASLDPYLHEWDERFHALVAKNMTVDPFRPTLFTRHIMAFNPQDWAYTDIWVHKQPLFLWQMAISIKLFGVSTFAIRLPSVIMGTIMVWLIYDIGRRWVKNDTVAFMGAFLAAFAYYALELISGWLSLEHNDLAFTFYMTCCFWAFTKYLDSDHKIKWAVLIGVFAGCAILNKWLVGLLIFGGWGLYVLLSKDRTNLKNYLHITLSVVVACIVFLPWQLYILKEFPFQSAIAFEYNRKHMTEALGHPGNAFFHFEFLSVAYNLLLILFLAIGLVRIFYPKNIDKNLTLSFVAMIAVVFGFFSFLVKTKMPAFVYPVSSIILILMAYGIYSAAKYGFNYLSIAAKHRNMLLLLVTLIAGSWSLKLAKITEYRSIENQARNNKVHNTKVFKKLLYKPDRYVTLNTRPYENIEYMFFNEELAYHWYPPESTLDSLQRLGYKFTAFEYLNDQQQLPEYIKNDSLILIIDKVLK